LALPRERVAMRFPSVLKTRRAVYVALAAAVVALVIPVSLAIAGNGSVVTVALQKNTYNCGLGSDHKAIGTVTFSRNKAGDLTVSVSIHGAKPSNEYTLYLYYAGPNCGYPFWGTIGKLKIDSSGNASKTVTFTGTNGYNDFYVWTYDSTDGHSDETTPAHLATG
jgi:hypothetical protein